MTNKIEVGQVLWLKVKYQIDVTSKVKYPMLVAKVFDDYIEIIALDKTADKMHLLFHNYNYYINSTNPKETVISEDSYAQLNTKLTLDNVEELKTTRKNNGKLSKNKLQDLLTEYDIYQEEYGVDEQRIVHMSKEEILNLNPDLKKEETLGDHVV